MIPGRASGVCLAALWNSTMEPGCTLDVTRFEMSDADRSFQSRLSPLAAGASGCTARDLRSDQSDRDPPVPFIQGQQVIGHADQISGADSELQLIQPTELLWLLHRV